MRRSPKRTFCAGWYPPPLHHRRTDPRPFLSPPCSLVDPQVPPTREFEASWRAGGDWGVPGRTGGWGPGWRSGEHHPPPAGTCTVVALLAWQRDAPALELLAWGAMHTDSDQHAGRAAPGRLPTTCTDCLPPPPLPLCPSPGRHHRPIGENRHFLSVVVFKTGRGHVWEVWVRQCGGRRAMAPLSRFSSAPSVFSVLLSVSRVC